MRVKTVRLIVLLMMVSMSSSGCVSLLLGGGDSPPRYTLEPVTFKGSVTGQVPGRLIIADPKAEAAFDTAQIALSIQPLRYEYYSQGEWADRAPRLLGIFLERSFENNGSIEAVGDRTTVPIGDYILQTDIREFHIDRQGDGRIARISYYARLSDGRNHSLATRLFTYNQPIDGKSLGDAIAAFNEAVNLAGADTVNWTIATMMRYNKPSNFPEISPDAAEKPRD